LIAVEAAIRAGEDKFQINGFSPLMAEACQARVQAAFKRADLPFPSGRVFVTLDGPVRDSERHYDLSIALAIARAAELIPRTAGGDWNKQEFFGEFTPAGELIAVDGLLPTLHGAANTRHCLYVPEHNWQQFTVLGRLLLAIVPTLRAAVEHLSGQPTLNMEREPPPPIPQPPSCLRLLTWPITEQARLGFVAAAAGSHPLLLIGADAEQRAAAPEVLRELLPPLAVHEAQDVILKASARGTPIAAADWGRRPLRTFCKSVRERREEQGRCTPLDRQCHEDLEQAYHGVLWLDEVSECEPRLLLELHNEVYLTAMFRQPYQLLMSARGVLTEENSIRRASLPTFAQRHATVCVDLTQRVPAVQLANGELECLSAQLHAQIANARQRQQRRAFRFNGQLADNEARYHCRGDEQMRTWLAQYLKHTALSDDSRRHLQRLVLTVADLDPDHTDGAAISQRHVQTALQLHGLRV
jgi:magnesium chelatase family protein